jgi:hypothetical protein
MKASRLDKSADLAPGDYVLVSVADTGEGMSEAVLARACEPFYTTKEPGKGSGLGLAQVYGLARQSGGGLRIKSSVGQGTTVEVYLPRSFVQGEAGIEWWDNERPRALGNRATVLVVDDQEDVREVTVAHLEALGYQVIQAASGRTALDLLGGTCPGVELVRRTTPCLGCPGSSWPGQCAPRFPICRSSLSQATWIPPASTVGSKTPCCSRSRTG